jgi:hypothetical protein
VLDIVPGSFAKDQLVVVEAVEGFGERIVVAVALGPNRGHDVRAVESFAVANPQVLNATIAAIN